MSEERYIAALEISSSKIIGVVGRAKENGQVDVIAIEQEKHVEVVRYGLIQNLEEAYLRIARIIDKLERKAQVAPRRIKSVFVGLAGRSIKSINTRVRLQLPEETEINDEILERLNNDAFNTAIDSSLEVVDVVPRSYRIGNLETMSPKGVVGNSIEAIFDIIVCRPELKRNIIKVVHDKLNIEVAGFVVTALATSHLVLPSEEKRLGCMLVDFGAETTAVSIYRNGALNYFATLPLGGRNITRDITSLSTLEERAEEIKISFGNALPPDTTSTINLNGVKFSDVSNLIVARTEEIVANVTEQIRYAGLKEKDLPGGIICIGGGAKLNGLTELLTRQTGLPAKIGRLPSYVHLEDAKAPSSEIVQVASVLYEGATLTDEVCLEMPKAQEVPATGEKPERPEEKPETPPQPGKAGRFIGMLKERISSLLTGSDEDESGLLDD